MKISRVVIYLFLMPLFIACQPVTPQHVTLTIAPVPSTPSPVPTSISQSPDSLVEFVWRIKGEPYRLMRPGSMAFDAQDNLYVIDGSNDRVQKFDRDGKFLLKWGGPGRKDGQFTFSNGSSHVSALAIDAQGLVYVADYKGIVQVFDGEGKFLRKWGGGLGDGDGQFISPRCMALDPQGNIYVADGDSDEHLDVFRIQKFDAEGHFLLKWSVQSFCLAVDQQSHVYVGNP